MGFQMLFFWLLEIFAVQMTECCRLRHAEPPVDVPTVLHATDPQTSLHKLSWAIEFLGKPDAS